MPNEMPVKLPKKMPLKVPKNALENACINAQIMSVKMPNKKPVSIDAKIVFHLTLWISSRETYPDLKVFTHLLVERVAWVDLLMEPPSEVDWDKRSEWGGTRERERKGERYR